MTKTSSRLLALWIATLLGGAVAGAAAQLVELILGPHRVGARVAFIATLLVALLGAVAVGGLTLLFALIFRRRWRLSPGPGERWAKGATIAVGLAMIGAGAVLDSGSGPRASTRTVAVAFALWCALAALAASRLAIWLARERNQGYRPARFAWRATLGLATILLVAGAVGAIRGEGHAPVGLTDRGASHEPPSAPLEPPPGSVVLIVLDTTRADAFGPYGSKSGETPVFDRFAAEGQLYEEMISTAPWTVPSHATFFTGLPPREHDCWFGGQRWLEDDLETVAEVFRRRGFETAAFFGNANLNLANLLQGFDVRDNLEARAPGLALGWAMRFTGVGFPEWIDRGAARGVRDLRTWLANRRSDRPFFLFVNLVEPHEPFVSPIRYHRAPPGVSELESFLALRRYSERVWHSLGRSQGREEDIVRAAYSGAIRYQDAMLGRLIEEIGKQYALDRLPIVLTADHGENLGEGGRWGHQFALNDTLIQLPFVVRAPGRVEAGTRVPGSFSSVDVPATLLDLAGAGQTFGRGRSLLGARTPEEATFAEDYPFYVTLNLLERDFKSGIGDFRWPLSAVRSEGHKLVIWHGGPTRLYDLHADPAETNDLLATRPEIAERLLARFAAWTHELPRQHRGAGAAAAAPTLLDPALADQLRALGYL